ncbi:ribosome small subunit-dependent GTPase A [Persicirhabdus sediminis]|uniref:Small ribosomal subunit biogenesis GTPase RsgA n=1 Tax=Persicirhabdus sediminis TaxID=454144 RepID=A0A8J7MBF5_9BACT|nr:ribosome small subunit-dependent GTPase A [Persicirhabdus sediminis]MBK1789953.1 ribosome small subunit-dependent GTPase A [Persicirhabdus sediminis]
MTLEDLGWNQAFAKEFAQYAKKGWVPARLIRDNKITYGALMVDEEGDFLEREVVMGGKVYHDAACDADLPAVGDWVALDLGGGDLDTIIRARMSRQTCFSRKVPGKSSEEQVMAANVNVVVVVTDAGPDFNPRRMERYFMLIKRSCAKAVVLVNKCDLFPAEQNEAAAEAIRALSSDVDVHITSAAEAQGLEVIKSYLKTGISITLVGSSGVGKSTLVNQLMGEEWQWTSEVNEVTGKGRHTTTARELIPLDDGGILIDNPGIREVQMWTNEETLRESFADIEEMAGQCKYHDCKHGNDAGCAIRAAVESGALPTDRYESYLKLDEEIAKLQKRQKKRQMNVERRNKRDHKVKARNLADRIEYEKDQRPNRSK